MYREMKVLPPEVLVGAGTPCPVMVFPEAYILMVRNVCQEMKVPPPEAFFEWLTMSCVTPHISQLNFHLWIVANHERFGATKVLLDSSILDSYYKERYGKMTKEPGHSTRDDGQPRPFTPEQGNKMGLYFFILLQNLDAKNIDTVYSHTTKIHKVQSNATLHGFHRTYAPRFQERIGDDPTLSDWQNACCDFLQDWFPHKKPNLFKWKKGEKNMALTKEQIQLVAYTTTYQYVAAVLALQQWWYIS